MNTDFSVSKSYGDLFSDALFNGIERDLTTLEGLLETTFDAFVGSLDLTGPALVEASEDATVFFDVDGDLFRERTGWLKSDDGFLVLDSNGNGRIDDISEMFGNQFEGGFAELAALDSNGDGRITVADAVWAELQVWQDFDYDGETDAGELSSLDALGIAEISLASTALNATTPQGTQLLSYGDVRFADGTLSTAYEAIFAAASRTGPGRSPPIRARAMRRWPRCSRAGMPPEPSGASKRSGSTRSPSCRWSASACASPMAWWWTTRSR